MSILAGKVALVTGGGRGIGRAIAMALAAAGAAVVITGRDGERLDGTRAAIEAQGGKALALICDVADSAAVRGAFAQAAEWAGPIDILVNNAGITTSIKFADTPDEIWEQIIQTNVNGPFYCTKAVVPAMISRRWGRVINIASIAATQGIPFSSAYGASKHALLGMTRSLAIELGRYGITVNAVCPGWVETDMLRASVENVAARTGRPPEEAKAELLRLGGQSKAVTPEEVAAAVVRLAGPEGDGVNGEAVMLL